MCINEPSDKQPSSVNPLLSLMEYSLPGDSTSALFETGLDESWSKGDDKEFESYLIISPDEDPNRLELISRRRLPWRTTDQLKKRYQELVADVSAIEAGQVPFPEYNDRDIWESVEEDERAEKVLKQKRNPEWRWTDEEQKLFLMGLKKLGNGDWRGIARHYVMTRTPKQVASHAQKFHMRKNGEGTSTAKRKRRWSIHDTTLDGQDGSRTQDPEPEAMVPENSKM